MKRNDISALFSLLISLSALGFAAGLLGAIWLCVAEALQQGGFFPGLGYALAALVFGAGNLLSFLLNAICYGLLGRPRWLRVALVAQALPALIFGAWGLGQLRDDWLSKKASEQHAALVVAIERDDVAALTAAWDRCGPSCRADPYTRPTALLLLASNAKAHRIAGSLIGHGAVVPGLEDGAMRPAAPLKSCEGFYLPSADALGTAVARNDADMVRLLLPVASEYSRSEALWLAAMLDRTALFELLLASGVPPRGPFPNDGAGNHLLSAAAAGAALRIGERLFDDGPPPPPPAVMQAATARLFQYMEETDGQPRAVAFARLLAAHGADLDAARGQQLPALSEAVRTHRQDVARLLLDAGADPERLSPAQKKALQTLLRQPVQPPYHGNDGDCIAQ